MKTNRILIAAIAALCTVTASAQDVQYKWYGFIRNYAHVDTHEMTALTADLFSYGPKDNDNENATWHLSAITSRLGLDVTGYKYNNMTATAKIEADFYNGVSGVTGTAVFRLRQAYVTLGWKNAYGNAYSLKVGQTWHPMAADMPDVISLNTGAPFGPFSRTPQAQYNQDLGSGWSLTAAAIWQQQYTSAGPEGPSANYMKYSGIPEVYAGVSYAGSNTILRAGLDFISIKPVQASKDRMNALTPFLYAQYKESLEKRSMGFMMTEWDDKLLKYGELFESKMMDLSVNIPLEDALDLGWEILADCFEPNETGLRSELIAQRWPKKLEA